MFTVKIPHKGHGGSSQKKTSSNKDHRTHPNGGLSPNNKYAFEDMAKTDIGDTRSQARASSSKNTEKKHLAMKTPPSNIKHYVFVDVLPENNDKIFDSRDASLGSQPRYMWHQQQAGRSKRPRAEDPVEVPSEEESDGPGSTRYETPMRRTDVGAGYDLRVGPPPTKAKKPCLTMPEKPPSAATVAAEQVWRDRSEAVTPTPAGRYYDTAPRPPASNGPWRTLCMQDIRPDGYVSDKVPKMVYAEVCALYRAEVAAAASATAAAVPARRTPTISDPMPQGDVRDRSTASTPTGSEAAISNTIAIGARSGVPASSSADASSPARRAPMFIDLTLDDSEEEEEEVAAPASNPPWATMDIIEIFNAAMREAAASSAPPAAPPAAAGYHVDRDGYDFCPECEEACSARMKSIYKANCRC